MRTTDRASGGADKVGSLRVCHLVSATNGARWAVEQLSWLRDRYGHDVTAVVGGSNGSLIDMLKEAGIRVHAEEGFGAYDSVASVLRLPATVWRLAWWLRRERFDVVQSHLLFAMIATRFAAWLADVPVRLAMYASPFHLEVPRALWMDRLMWWTDTRLIASCNYTDDILARLGVASARRAVIYYGADNDQYDPDKTPAVDLRAEYGWPSSTNIVVKVAYFYAKMSDNDWVPAVLRGKNPKGFVDLVRATPAVLARHPETKVVLVGDGWGKPGTAYMEEMRHLVQDLGLSESIIFAGFRRDTAGILRGADVAVQASLYENVGGVIESLMVECPTVATAVCGMVDCVIDGETGILVRPSDPADLARGINDMLCDRPRARALAANGGILARERFSLARTCADLDQLYRAERSALRRRFYNPLVSLARCAIGAPILAWFVLRVAYRDFYVTSHWPTHRNRLKSILDTTFSIDTYWRSIANRLPYGPFPGTLLPLRIRWANRRATAGLHLARWRIELPMHLRMYRQRLTSWVRNHLATLRGQLVTAGLHLRRWRVELPMHGRVHLQGMVTSIKGRAITAGLHARRRWIEAPMYLRMYRQQTVSWLGNHSPGWGLLRKLAELRRAQQPNGLGQAALQQPPLEPPVCDSAE